MFRKKSIFPVLARKRWKRSSVAWVNLLLYGVILSNAYLIATPPRTSPPLPYYEATQTLPQECEYARVQLIADTSIIVPGESFLLGIRFELEKDWHLYWENPGSSGFPLSVEWNLPTGFKVGPLQFPSPQRYELSGFVTYVHEEAPMFIVPVTVPKKCICKYSSNHTSKCAVVIMQGGVYRRFHNFTFGNTDRRVRSFG